MKFSKRIDLWLFQYLRLLRFSLCRASYSNAITFDSKHSGRAESGAGLMIFTAADSVYLSRFLRPFARSAAAHLSNPRLHVHLYNPQAEDFDRLRSVEIELRNLSLSWSHETFSPATLEQRSKSSRQQSWKSLYICTSRFLAARAAQEKFGRALLITDIDILFNGNVDERFAGSIDVALLLRPQERNMCKRTLGGVVYVSARPQGRAFLSQTCSDISRFLAARFYWFAFDQLALYRAVRAMPKEGFNDVFSQLTANDISFDLGQNGLILFPKGKLKDQQAFADLVQTYAETADRQ